MNEPVQRARVSGYAHPGPSGASEPELVEIEVEGRTVTLVGQDGSRQTLRPNRIRVARIGRLQLICAAPVGTVRLDFEEGPRLPIASPRQWAARFATVSATGYQDLLAALQAAGVPIDADAGAQANTGAIRASLVIATPVLVLVELALFGVTSGLLGQLLGGGTAVPDGVETVVVSLLLVALLGAALYSARIPAILSWSWRNDGELDRDPVASYDAHASPMPTWGTSVTAVLTDRLGPSTDRSGTLATFVPLRPRLPNIALGLILLVHTASWIVRERQGGADAPRTGTLLGGEPAPDWLDPVVVAVLGYLLAAGLAVAWVVALVRSRRDGPTTRHRVIGAAILTSIFASYAGFFESGSYRGETWDIFLATMVIGVHAAAVGIALARWWLLLAALVGTVVVLLAAGDAFASTEMILGFGVVALLVAAIAWRSVRDGALPVPMPYKQRIRLNRQVLVAVVLKWTIGFALLIGWGDTLLV